MPYIFIKSSHGRQVIAASRLGVSNTPDELGTCTTKVRPGNLKDGLRIIDTVAVVVRRLK